MLPSLRVGADERIVNTGAFARARKSQIMNDTKFGFQNDSQELNTMSTNISDRAQLKHQGTPKTTRPHTPSPK